MTNKENFQISENIFTENFCEISTFLQKFLIDNHIHPITFFYFIDLISR